MKKQFKEGVNAVTYFLAGMIVGITLSLIVRLSQLSTGVLRIDRSDPEKDIYRLDIGNLDKLSKKKEIRLLIDNNADLSQK